MRLFRFCLIQLIRFTRSRVLVCSLAGFTVLPVSAAEWTQAAAGFQYHFPADHAAHRDYKTEWWYFTGNVRDAKSGHEFGYELTFFRQGVLPPGEGPDPADRSRFLQPDFKFAHLAITDLHGGKFHFAQKITRGAFGEAGFGHVTDPRLVWLDDWEVRPQSDGAWQIRARALDPKMSLDLLVKPLKPPVIQGTDGISQKAAGFGNASHYYSFTRLETSGTLSVGDSPAATVRGESWFDHEWASNALGSDQIGWNWFCFQLDDQTELMLYAMRRRDGTVDPVSSGTLIAADGTTEHLRREDYTLEPGRTWRSPHTGAVYPMEWTVRIPSRQLEFHLAAKLDDQELVLPPISYWEGAIGFSGRKGGREIKGEGYMELTGYANALGGVRGNEAGKAK